MDDLKKKQIKSFLQQAEVYQSQGLLKEAKEKYIRAGQLLKKNKLLIKNKNLLNIISKKLRALNQKIELVENEPASVELPQQVQKIIKEKFSFSKDADAAGLEGAIALAKFGQFEAALREFDQLIEKDTIRIEAAKNIIRCHMALDSINDALARYKEWASGVFFTSDQLSKLRTFFQGILDSKGIDTILPEMEPTAPVTDTTLPQIKELTVPSRPELPDEPEIEEEDIIDISSVGITVDEGPKKGEIVEYDVSFQAGNVINFLISSDDEAFVETLRIGLIMDDVQFYSPIAMFSGKAVVSSKSKIESGPKQGYYSLDIKITSI
ncbi:MAG: hypothetical protein B6245_17195 [Desulfobacteraceae bacterium 4572_88]|nr:MAG: hypothetical protein B6245_17195 [Desulfobacteraceae bacterium 4572_88]RLC09950.1 MAG: hypothetical protein DRI57_21180 [Deltaproteobacteria bacterium]